MKNLFYKYKGQPYRMEIHLFKDSKAKNKNYLFETYVVYMDNDNSINSVHNLMRNLFKKQYTVYQITIRNNNDQEVGDINKLNINNLKSLASEIEKIMINVIMKEI
jgi:predicted transcriptional regulator